MPFSEVVGAPGHARGGLHGAHPRRRGVPRPARRGGGDDDGDDHGPDRRRRRRTPGRDGFTHLLRAEWTKLRTVRGWIVGLVVAVLVALVLGLLAAAAATSRARATSPRPVRAGRATRATASSADRSARTARPCATTLPSSHQPLPGDGSITARVTSLAGRQPPTRPDDPEPWAKAGLMVKAGTAPGSTLRGDHGHRRPRRADAARLHARRGGQPGPASPRSSPRWLRLTRSGDTRDRLRVGRRRALDRGRRRRRLPGWARAARWACSWPRPTTRRRRRRSAARPRRRRSHAGTGRFDDVTLGDGWRAGAWARAVEIGRPRLEGSPAEPARASGSRAGTFTVTGSGDIAPMRRRAERPAVERHPRPGTSPG